MKNKKLSKLNGRIIRYDLYSPIKVKFSEAEIVDYALKQLGVEAPSEALQTRIAELNADCDANGYMTMDLLELMDCLKKGVKTEDSVGEILMYQRNTKNELYITDHDFTM